MKTKYDDYNYSWLMKGSKWVQKEITITYEVPELLPCKLVDFSRAIPITEVWNARDFNQGVHFYVHDKYFFKYLNPLELDNLAIRLKKFNFVISPDFSLLGDAPDQNHMMNIYRNMGIAHYLQKRGVNVVPNVRGYQEETHQYSCLGIPKNHVIAIGSYGNYKSKLSRKLLISDFDFTIEELSPKIVIVYGCLPQELIGYHGFKDITFIQIDNWRKSHLKALSTKREVF